MFAPIPSPNNSHVSYYQMKYESDHDIINDNNKKATRQVALTENNLPQSGNGTRLVQ